MSEEKKNVVLKEEKLKKAAGGILTDDIFVSCPNYSPDTNGNYRCTYPNGKDNCGYVLQGVNPPPCENNSSNKKWLKQFVSR